MRAREGERGTARSDEGEREREPREGETDMHESASEREGETTRADEDERQAGRGECGDAS